MKMTKQPLLTIKKQEWAEQFRFDGVMRGTPLAYSAALTDAYERRLLALTKQMTQTTSRQILRLFKSEVGREFFAQDESLSSQARILTNELLRRFSDNYNKRAKKLAHYMVRGAEKQSKSALHYSLREMSGGLSIKTSTITPALREVMKASIAENVALIKSIPQEYFAKIQGAVMRSITTGRGLADLEPYLNKMEKTTVRRVQLIARDQTKKVYSQINKQKMTALGVKKFQWVHNAGSVEPRELHQELDGQIFSFDDPPIIDDNTGERGLPAQLINCNCTMIPVIEFGDGE
jgi:SPP1 gp7 family putative phage head morphogenesis protein